MRLELACGGDQGPRGSERRGSQEWVKAVELGRKVGFGRELGRSVVLGSMRRWVSKVRGGRGLLAWVLGGGVEGGLGGVGGENEWQPKWA